MSFSECHFQKMPLCKCNGMCTLPTGNMILDWFWFSWCKAVNPNYNAISKKDGTLCKTIVKVNDPTRCKHRPVPTLRCQNGQNGKKSPFKHLICSLCSIRNITYIYMRFANHCILFSFMFYTVSQHFFLGSKLSCKKTGVSLSGFRGREPECRSLGDRRLFI